MDLLGLLIAGCLGFIIWMVVIMLAVTHAVLVGALAFIAVVGIILWIKTVE